ncbi:MAG TPA: enoyl-CoA hydratase [Pyrinomonadaceae bacterium]|jgi:2-(1,2-epoxy-1,2-dihydrophenyl)acetyl-CoA isomerase
MENRSKKLLISLENGIKRITFNRPERRNSVDAETLEKLFDAVRESAADETRVIILTGAGDSFCAGADLLVRSESEIAEYDVTAYLRDIVNPTILAMRALPVPIIARVHGHAVGIGCNYALASDLVIASDAALFGQVFVKIGLMPDGGSTFLLPALVGYQKAFELIALGDIIKADEAEKLGFVNRVVPFADLDATVDGIAQRLVEAPRVALENIKAGLNRHLHSALAAALEFEAAGQDACFHSPDFVEGVTAFAQKRKPVFNRIDKKAPA